MNRLEAPTEAPAAIIIPRTPTVFELASVSHEVRLQPGTVVEIRVTYGLEAEDTWSQSLGFEPLPDWTRVVPAPYALSSSNVEQTMLVTLASDKKLLPEGDRDPEVIREMDKDSAKDFFTYKRMAALLKKHHLKLANVWRVTFGLRVEKGAALLG